MTLRYPPPPAPVALEPARPGGYLRIVPLPGGFVIAPDNPEDGTLFLPGGITEFICRAGIARSDELGTPLRQDAELRPALAAEAGGDLGVTAPDDVTPVAAWVTHYPAGNSGSSAAEDYTANTWAVTRGRAAGGFTITPGKNHTRLPVRTLRLLPAPTADGEPTAWNWSPLIPDSAESRRGNR